MHTWLAFNFAAPGRFGNNIIFGNRHINVIMHANLPVPDVFCTLDIWLAFIFAATGGFGNNIMLETDISVLSCKQICRYRMFSRRSSRMRIWLALNFAATGGFGNEIFCLRVK